MLSPRFRSEIGFGLCFRYFTGVVEILGSILVLIPWTVTARWRFSHAPWPLLHILVFVTGRPAESVFFRPCTKIFLGLPANSPSTQTSI
jgi:hypothetical protein